MENLGRDAADSELDRLQSDAELAADTASSADDANCPASIEEELADSKGRLVRLQADMENYRKRMDRTIVEIVRSRLADAMRGMLPVVDSLDRAIDAVDPDSADVRGIFEGVRLTRKQMGDVLKGQGIEPIEADGEFDPAFHEVVATVTDSGRNDGEIVDVVRNGYSYGDIILRPASVRVAKTENDGLGVDLEA